jgi:hypothetical protein
VCFLGFRTYDWRCQVEAMCRDRDRDRGREKNMEMIKRDQIGSISLENVDWHTGEKADCIRESYFMTNR